MAERHDVLVRVKSIKGKCPAEHQVGEEFLMGRKTPAGICLSAFNVISPAAQVLKFGGSFPWEEDPDVATVVCPDVANPVVFELRRLPK